MVKNKDSLSILVEVSELFFYPSEHPTITNTWVLLELFFL